MTSRPLAPVLALFAALTAAPALLAGPFPDFPNGSVPIVALQSGPWHDSQTWTPPFAKRPIVPAAGDVVHVPQFCPAGSSTPCRVTVQTQETAAQSYVRVDGELRLSIHSDTRLKTETLYVADTGTFRIGDTTFPVRPQYTAELVFTGSGAIDSTWDPKQVSRGLISDGAIRWYGQDRVHAETVSVTARQGATSLTLDQAPGNWEVGDEVVIAGTHFARTAAETSSQDEVRTLTGVSGDTITFSPGLAHDRWVPAATGLHAGQQPRFHVANLTRNLVVRSAAASPTLSRGHVMFRSGDVEIKNASFISLGRTDKRIPLDDLTVNIDSQDFSIAPAANPSNRRGRYSVHFHRNGSPNPVGPPPSEVHGSVVRDALGWGFVNHASHVDFRRNVVHDFYGAAFVTEGGDELGNFSHNVAIRGKGDGDYDPIYRFVFENTERPQPLSDFAFRGHGFWFQGPAVSATDNVASGCDGAGMVWFTTGAPESDPSLFFEYPPGTGKTKNPYVFFPESWAQAIYGASTVAGINPRRWDFNLSDMNNSPPTLAISDLPILEMNGFEAYGNYVGFRLRFNNSHNGAWYNEGVFDYSFTFMKPYQSTNVNRETQRVDNLLLWNNQQGFRMRYADDTDWSGITVLNTLAFDANAPTSGLDGAEMFHTLEDHQFDDTLIIRGHPVAGRLWNGSLQSDSEVLFVAGTGYQGQANDDAWDGGHNCQPTPSGLGSAFAASRQKNSASVTLSWSSPHPRHSLRYRLRPDAQSGPNPPWAYEEVPSGTSRTVSGLASGELYEYQVIAGCGSDASASLSQWSTVGTFSTP